MSCRCFLAGVVEDDQDRELAAPPDYVLGRLPEIFLAVVDGDWLVPSDVQLAMTSSWRRSSNPPVAVCLHAHKLRVILR